MDELKKAYRIAVVIGFAMIVSLFIYIALVEILKLNIKSIRGFSSFAGLEILRYVFFGIVIAVFFLIKFIRNSILSRKTIDERPSEQKVTFSSKIQKLFSATVVTYALCESVAIFGLVLFFIGGSSFDFYLFIAFSLMFFAIYFPKYPQWEEYVGSN